MPPTATPPLEEGLEIVFSEIAKLPPALALPLILLLFPEVRTKLGRAFRWLGEALDPRSPPAPTSPTPAIGKGRRVRARPRKKSKRPPAE